MYGEADVTVSVSSANVTPVELGAGSVGTLAT